MIGRNSGHGSRNNIMLSWQKSQQHPAHQLRQGWCHIRTVCTPAVTTYINKTLNFWLTLYLVFVCSKCYPCLCGGLTVHTIEIQSCILLQVVRLRWGTGWKAIFVENNHGCLTHCVSSSVVARSRHISRSNSSWRFEMTHGRLSKLNSISGLLACTWPLSKKFLDAHTVGNKAILPLCSVLMPHAWLGMNWGIHCSMECIRRSSKEAGMPGTQRPDWWSRGSGQHVFKSDPQ